MIDTGPEALVGMTEERAFVPIGWGPGVWRVSFQDQPLTETAPLAKAHPG